MYAHDIPETLTLTTRPAQKDAVPGDTVELLFYGISPSSFEQTEVEGGCGPYDDDGENC